MDQNDYYEMYLKMVRASEEAINILIQAQRECEEMYMSARFAPDDSNADFCEKDTIL